jgi:hypothetical protein
MAEGLVVMMEGLVVRLRGARVRAPDKGCRLSLALGRGG